MAGTTRFILSNRLTTATLLNGTGAPAPARDETSPFTMEKLMTADRLAFYKSSSLPTYPVSMDFDLGANRSCGAAAVHGFTALLDTGGPTIVTSFIVYYSTAANGYPPVSGNPWTAAGTISTLSSPRDAGVVFAGGAASARYWRFEPNGVGGQFVIGRLALGPVTDLSVVSSAGYAPRGYGNRLETRMLNGDPAFQILNENLAYDFLLPMRDVTNSTSSTLWSLLDQDTSFTMIDYNDVFREAWLADKELEGSLNWYAGTSASELWDHDLRLRCFA